MKKGGIFIKHRFSRAVCLLVALLLLCQAASCGGRRQLPKVTSPITGKTAAEIGYTPFEEDEFPFLEERNEILRLTNEFRAQSGLPPLSAADSNCVWVAMSRCRESTILFEHTRPNGEDWATVLPEFGVSDWTLIGENLACYYDTPAQALQAWIDSPGHRENMLREFTHMGVGVYRYKDSYHWSQFFITY